MPTVQPHVAGSTSRQIPEDMRQYRYHHGYVVTTCDGKAQAEVVAQALVDAGFEREELILVSHDVDELEAGWHGEDTLEVHNPESLDRPIARFAGAATGAVIGALAGVTAAYLSGRQAADFGIWALAGLLLGLGLGAVIGVVLFRHFLRRPAAFYDGKLSGEQVLVGIGLRTSDDEEHRSKARATFEKLRFPITELPE